MPRREGKIIAPETGSGAVHLFKLLVVRISLTMIAQSIPPPYRGVCVHVLAMNISSLHHSLPKGAVGAPVNASQVLSIDCQLAKQDVSLQRSPRRICPGPLHTARHRA